MDQECYTEEGTFEKSLEDELTRYGHGISDVRKKKKRISDIGVSEAWEMKKHNEGTEKYSVVGTQPGMDEEVGRDLWHASMTAH